MAGPRRVRATPVNSARVAGCLANGSVCQEQTRVARELVAAIAAAVVVAAAAAAGGGSGGAWGADAPRRRTHPPPTHPAGRPRCVPARGRPPQWRRRPRADPGATPLPRRPGTRPPPRQWPR